MAVDSLPELIRQRAEAGPDSPALLAVDGPPLTYRDLHDLIRTAAADLRMLGVGRSDRVALVVPNGPEAAAAFLALASASACTPLNPVYREWELDAYLVDLKPSALVVAGETPARDVARDRGIPVLELEPAEGGAGRFRLAGRGSERAETVRLAGPDDVALVLHTSGTTSRPKQVPLTHANLCASAASVAATLELGTEDRCLNVMPLFHVHGLVAAVLASLHAGGSVTCTPGFHAASFFTWLEEHAATWYTAVPTIHQDVIGQADRAGVGRLRFVRSSSAPLPRSLGERVESSLGVPVVEAYGMTEAAHQITSNPLPPGERRPGSVGRPAGADVAVLDGDGRRLPNGQIGEVAIRGPNVFSGYADNPEANSSAFVGGWLRTGDEGVLDDDGYLYLRGRLKEIINRGGEKIAPGEVEDALLAHPAVANAVAFAVPDSRLGEEVGAAVVLRRHQNADELELQRFVGDRLAAFKVPRVVAVVEEIPKGSTGKLQRLGMAERLGITGPR